MKAVVTVARAEDQTVRILTENLDPFSDIRQVVIQQAGYNPPGRS